MRQPRAFTLVELLVVVAIIVALLAILIPSMSRAVYVATLTRCASNLKQVGCGYFTLASDHFGRFRAYDHTKVTHLKEGASDMRPFLGEYLVINDLACPFLPRLEYIDPPKTTNRIEWTYLMYAGFKMADEEKRLDRPGDFFTQYGQRYSVLAADLIVVRIDGSSPQSSHPGFDMGLYLAGANPAPVVPSYTYPVAHKHTFIRWENPAGSLAQGQTDLNYLFTDGAVRTKFHLRHGDPEMGMGSPFNSNPNWYSYLPLTP